MSSEPRKIGEPVPEVQCSLPVHKTVVGKHVKLHPMKAEHADQLYKGIAGKGKEALYDYMFYGPFLELDAFREHIASCAASEDTQFYSIEDLRTGDLVGQLSHLRIVPQHRCIEIGHIMYGPALQRTVGATEAWYLLAQKAFDEGYRRLEWKCDNANRASYRAAIRYGHTFEGVFRQHMIIKGRNRDSAWFSILDTEWPARKQALETWMSQSNLDQNGRQKRDLAAIQAEVQQKNSQNANDS